MRRDRILLGSDCGMTKDIYSEKIDINITDYIHATGYGLYYSIGTAA